MTSSANKSYKFDIVNGAVVAVYEIKNGRVEFERMERDETWSLDGSNIVKTELDDGRLETTVYTDANRDGVFLETLKTYGNAQSLELSHSGDKDDGIDNDNDWDSNDSDTHLEDDEHAPMVSSTSSLASVDSDGYEHHEADAGSRAAQGSLNRQNSIRGSDGDDAISGGNYNDILDGGTGSDSLRAGSGDDILIGGGHDDAGINRLEGGDGDDILVAGGQTTSYFQDFFNVNAALNTAIHSDAKFSGVASIVDGIRTGQHQQLVNEFQFRSGSGNDIVMNFHTEADKIQIERGLNGSDIWDFSTLLGHLTVDGSNVTIDLGLGNSICLVGIDPAALSAHDFLWV